LIPTIEAILRVFNEHGNRKNKFKARLKFVLRQKGIDEFRRLVAAMRATLTAPPETFTIPTPVGPPPPAVISAARRGEGFPTEYQRWAQYNLQPQRDPEYSVVWIKLPAGTILSSQLRRLADLLERHGLAVARTTTSQNIVIPYAPVQKAEQIYNDLKALGLALPGARTISDVTACPGGTTCNLGITRSLTLAEVLTEHFAEEVDPQSLKINIKISGCPNSCGQHHIADIGLYGNARRIAGRQAPYYQLLLGGAVTAEEVHFARQVVAIPARRIPQALSALLEFYKQDRMPDEPFRIWVARTSDEAITARLEKFVDTSDASEDLFIDWGDREPFSLGLKRGECAA